MTVRVLFTVALVASLGSAAQPAGDAPTQLPSLEPTRAAPVVAGRLEHHDSPIKTAGYILSSTAVAALATGLSLTAGVAVHSLPLVAIGRPNGWVTTAGLAAALGLNLALDQLTLPWLAAAFRGAPDVSTVRERSWRTLRWSVIAAGLSVASYALGTGLEQHSFGSGQSLMLAGSVLCVVTLFATNVLAATMSWVGAR